MTLIDRLNEDMKTAMKEKEAGKIKLSVIRMVRNAIKNSEIEKRRLLSEEEILEVLAKEVKMRRDSIAEYEKAQRPDIVENLQKEIEILLDYLPQQLSEEELREIVRETIAQVNATSVKEMGKVMAAIMPKVKGRADGKIVNQLVRSALEA